MGRLKKPELFALIHDYMKVYLPDQKNSSPHTITSSRTSLEQLIDFICDILGVSIPLSGSVEYYIIFVFACAIVLTFAVALVRFLLAPIDIAARFKR